MVQASDSLTQAREVLAEACSHARQSRDAVKQARLVKGYCRQAIALLLRAEFCRVQRKSEPTRIYRDLESVLTQAGNRMLQQARGLLTACRKLQSVVV